MTARPTRAAAIEAVTATIVYAADRYNTAKIHHQPEERVAYWRNRIAALREAVRLLEKESEDGGT